MFRICATARLFIDTMLPEVDSGIFLDTDIVMMDDILNLWRQLKQFSPAQVHLHSGRVVAPIADWFSSKIIFVT